MSEVPSPDDDDLMTLKDACRLIFKNAIGPDTLRAEAQRGRLTIERIGRRQFVTRGAIREMRKKCEVAPSPKDQGSGSNLNDPTPTEASRRRSGSSGTDLVSVARAAALMTLEELSAPSKPTSRRSTDRKSAKVIPLKSSRPTS